MGTNSIHAIVTLQVAQAAQGPLRLQSLRQQVQCFHAKLKSLYVKILTPTFNFTSKQLNCQNSHSPVTVTFRDAESAMKSTHKGKEKQKL